MKRIVWPLALVLLVATTTLVRSQTTPEPQVRPDLYSLPLLPPTDLPPRCVEWARQKRAQFTAADRHRDAPVDLVMAGDSLIEGFLPLPLASRYQVVNRGIACDTTRGLHERLLRDVVVLRPKAAVLLIGINDLSLLDRMPPEERALLVVTNLNSLALRLKGLRIQPLVLSLLPTRIALPGLSVDGSNELIRDLNAEVRRFCRRMDVLFLDVHGALADERRRLREDLTGDGLHLNMEGYRLLGSLLAPVLLRMLSEPSRSDAGRHYISES